MENILPAKLPVGTIAALLFLLFNSVCDIRKRRISLRAAALAGGCGIVFALMERKDLPAGLFLSLMPGAVLLLLGLLSRWAVGGGDGIEMLVFGLYYPAAETAEILLLALLISSLLAIVLLIMKKKGKESFPFLPCLLMGNVLFLVLPK